MESPLRIAVVGSGVAALTAACRILEEYSCFGKIELSVFEAAPIAGGRVRSIPLPDDPHGNHVNLGANWIHGIEDNPLYTILAEEKTRMEKSVDGLYIPSNSSLVISSKGEKISSDVVQKTYELLEKLYLEVEDGLKTPPEEAPIDEQEMKSKDVGFGTLLEEHLVSKLGKETIAAGQTSELSEIYQLFKSRVSSYNGLDLCHQSAAFWKSDHDSEGDHVFVSNYSKLISNCVRRIQSKGGVFYFNSRVIHISETSSSSTTQNGSHLLRIQYLDTNLKQTKTFPLDFHLVCVTVPIGVLKKGTIQFEPPLPPHKQEAIRNIAVGIYEIIALRYDEPFWLDSDESTQPDWIEVSSCPETDNEPLLLVNYYKYFQVPILLVHLWGDQAVRLCQLSESELAAKMNLIMKRTFKKFEEVKWLKCSKWHLEEDVLTGFSAMKIGCSPYDLDRLAQTEANGTLFFGGEATYKQNFGTVSGAYWSGLDVALKMKEKIKQLSQQLTSPRERVDKV